MTTLALYNLKGGVGKTAAAVNLAYLSALSGRRTLLWDLDPQGASSFYFRVKPKIKGGRDRLLEKKRRNLLHEHVRGSDYDRLDLVPSDFSYREMDLALGSAKKPERRLARLLRPLHAHYDLVLLDCPPSLSATAESVFHAADVLVTPIIPTTLSLRTLEHVRSHVDELGIDLPIWPFFSMVDGRKTLHADIITELAHHPDTLDAQIPNASDIERMGVERQPVAAFAPSSKGARAYLSLWSEIERRLIARS